MPAKYRQTKNPKPTEDCPMPVIINKSDRSLRSKYTPKITDVAGNPMAYYGFLSVLRTEDGKIIDTLSRHTKLYTAVNGKTMDKPGDGIYLPESQSSIDTMFKQTQAFPTPVCLYTRPTVRLAWTLVGEEPE